MARNPKPENLRRATKKYRLAHPDRIRDSARRCYAKYAEQRCAQQKVRAARLKLEVLTHYSVDGRLCCSSPDCDVSDIDMLTLDHIENDGAQQRRELYGENKGYSGGSKRLYSHVKLAGYPPGFQTLCWNHQWKKELARIRALPHKKQAPIVKAMHHGK